MIMQPGICGDIYGGIPSVLSITMQSTPSRGACQTGKHYSISVVFNCVLDPISFLLSTELFMQQLQLCFQLLFSFYFLVVYLRIRQTSYISLCPFGHRFEWSLGNLLVGLPSCWLTIPVARASVQTFLIPTQ